MFALCTGTAFECLCDRGDCAAQSLDLAHAVAAVRSEVHIHVVTDPATLDGTPGVAWMDVHGVISDERVRDLAARSDATVTPLTPVRTPPTNVEPVVVYPGAQPSDPYRPTRSCADFVHVRHGYCGESGCDRSAFDSDLDHVAEFGPPKPVAGWCDVE